MTRLTAFARHSCAVLARGLAPALALTLVAGAGGCADEVEAVIITGFLPLSSDACAATPGTYQSRSLIDVSFDTGAVFALEVRNNLKARATNSAGLPDDSEIQLDSARFTVSSFAEDGSEVELGAFLQPIPSTSLAGGAVATVFLELTPSQVAELGAAAPPGEQATLVLDVEVSAFRAGGLGRIEARPFRYPVTLCFGCLRECLPTLDDSDPPMDLCTPSACASSIVDLGGTCGYAQDLPVNPPCCSGDATTCSAG